MKEGLLGEQTLLVAKQEPRKPVHVVRRMDLCRERLDFDALLSDGERFERALSLRMPMVGRAGAAIGRCERAGVGDDRVDERRGASSTTSLSWPAGCADADAYKAKGLARLACKTDKIDSWVLAELGRLQLVPEVWLADPAVRAERERARFRLHLVKHRTALKNRIHATLIAFGVPNPTSDLFGAGGRDLLARVSLPEPWRQTTQASLKLIDFLEAEISGIEQELRASRADHRYIPLLLTCPGVGWILAFTIASRARRHHTVPNTDQVRRLHRPLPQGRPVG